MGWFLAYASAGTVRCGGHGNFSHLVCHVIRVEKVLVLFVRELVAVFLVERVRPEHVAQGPVHLRLGETVNRFDVRQVLDLLQKIK